MCIGNTQQWMQHLEYIAVWEENSTVTLRCQRLFYDERSHCTCVERLYERFAAQIKRCNLDSIWRTCACLRQSVLLYPCVWERERILKMPPKWTSCPLICICHSTGLSSSQGEFYVFVCLCKWVTVSLWLNTGNTKTNALWETPVHTNMSPIITRVSNTAINTHINSHMCTHTGEHTFSHNLHITHTCTQSVMEHTHSPGDWHDRMIACVIMSHKSRRAPRS